MRRKKGSFNFLAVFIFGLTSSILFSQPLKERDTLDATYRYLNYETKELHVKNNDTISYIKETLKKYKKSAFACNYLSKYIVNDSIFFSGSNVDDRKWRFEGRITKREDFNVLFIIYMELYLKYKVPEGYKIATIFIIPDSYRKRTYGKRYIRKPPLENPMHLSYDYGKQYVSSKQMFTYDFMDYYVPAHLKMIEIYDAFEKWMVKVEKLGSLEKARKKGLDPFKDTEFRFDVVTIKLVEEYNRMVALEYDSFFPRFPDDKKQFSSEMKDKQWISSYKDCKKW